MLDIEYQFQILEFKMQMLQAEIEMQAMIGENWREQGKYGYNDFMALIDKHRIHANAIPCYRG